MRTTEVVVGLSAIAMSIASGEQGRYGALALGLVSARFWAARFHPNPLKGMGIPARFFKQKGRNPEVCGLFVGRKCLLRGGGLRCNRSGLRCRLNLGHQRVAFGFHALAQVFFALGALEAAFAFSEDLQGERVALQKEGFGLVELFRGHRSRLALDGGRSDRGLGRLSGKCAKRDSGQNESRDKIFHGEIAFKKGEHR